MITLVSTPEYVEQVSPEIITRWLATESPNIFRLHRKDYVVSSESTDSGSPENTRVTLTEAYTGNVGNTVSLYSDHDKQMHVGVVTAIASPATTIDVDIAWNANFDFLYINDHTERAGYYFEGRLTVNDAVQSLTIIASPDTFGVGELDVSGILRIMVTLGKQGDYSELITAETNKSGSFTLEYRECWFGELGSYVAEGNTWYYAEAIRSVEQGSNLHEYVATEASDATFFNSFTNPVYFRGLPFDVSFILPHQPAVSPAAEMTVTIKSYNANNTLLSTVTTQVPISGLDGRVCSLSLSPDEIAAGAAYFTAEITT